MTTLPRLAEDRRAAFTPWTPGRATVRMALDRSVRSYDQDGRLRIATALLTRAEVSEYLGSEVPGWESLGLQQDRLYGILRPEDELRKSLRGWNGLPLLSAHVPVSAEYHRGDLVVGSTGTDATLSDGELFNSLTIWAAEGVRLIETGAARALSCGYGYTPVLHSGTFQGRPHQIVMVDLKPNHVALVGAPRVDGAIVGDSAITPKGKKMAGGIDPDSFVDFCTFLKSKLQPADFATAIDKLLTGGGAAEPYDLGMDDPPPFPGRPRPGGGMDPMQGAMDAARALRLAHARGYTAAGARLAARFPNFNRLRA